ncbi:uncharacterized protein BDCG_06538 [Blastomyces dermatitidis ER-3]|uniref:Uncharacterized protein n=1 Tax=Ajellomyces dermatitidis (strain ER-3 / ATCC MYA-2586) TaxID=559297 RepID=A0ABP2F6K8_AJEDR|nr:uncharacterized protein BDCG_06538 [Blastomyces dermatitidis ER-3]EEQ91418.1 hypothetical protein BDCG_06538 [Blastomyces dermatitidis ER-3]
MPQHQRPLGREREPSGEIDSERDVEQEVSIIEESKSRDGLWASVSNASSPVIATPGWTNAAPVSVESQGSWNGSGDFFYDGGYTDTYSPLGSSGGLSSPSKSSHVSDADAGGFAQQYGCSECSYVFERRYELKHFDIARTSFGTFNVNTPSQSRISRRYIARFGGVSIRREGVKGRGRITCADILGDNIGMCIYLCGEGWDERMPVGDVYMYL